MEIEFQKEVDDYLAQHQTSSGKPKIFVIGFNKTGTATLRNVLRSFGFAEGNQHIGELLLEDYLNNRTDRILALCETGDFFRDVPFSMPGLYKAVYEKYPDAKYILTLRDNPEQWYASMMKFHSNLFASGRRLKLRHLKNVPFKYKGYLFLLHQVFSGGQGVLKKAHYLKVYNDHLADVRSFFSKREADFLELNVASPGAYLKLCGFLGLEPQREEFPVVNKTRRKNRWQRFLIRLGI